MQKNKRAAAAPVTLKNNVVSIFDHSKFKPAAAPPFRIAKRKDKYPRVSYTVSGESLSGFGIIGGDSIVCDTIFTAKDVINQICVIRRLADGDRMAKLVCPNYDGTATLKVANADYDDQTLKLDEFEVLGIVRKLQRAVNPVDVAPLLEANNEDKNKSRKITELRRK